jgi:hypothetical protein
MTTPATDHDAAQRYAEKLLEALPPEALLANADPLVSYAKTRAALDAVNLLAERYRQARGMAVRQIRRSMSTKDKLASWDAVGAKIGTSMATAYGYGTQLPKEHSEEE